MGRITGLKALPLWLLLGILIGMFVSAPGDYGALAGQDGESNSPLVLAAAPRLPDVDYLAAAHLSLWEEGEDTYFPVIMKSR